MNRKRFIPFLVFALLVIGIGYWGITQYNAKRQLQVHLGNQYQRSFYELVSHVESIEVLLAKALITNSLSQNVLTLANISREANLALESLSQLPIAQLPMSQTSKFLSQTGDLAYSSAKRAAKGMPIVDKDWDNLQVLHAQAGRISQELHQMQGDAADGAFNWAELRDLKSIGRGRATATSINDGFRRLEQQMEEEGPTLIYDGPFSDHMERLKPLGLTGEEVTSDEASKIAKNFVEIKSDVEFIVDTMGDTGGNIPSYQFQMRPKSRITKGGINEIIDIDVSKKGGHVVWMINTRDIDRKMVSVSEALGKGAEFLKKRGYDSMVPTYAAQQGEVIVANYVYKWNDIIVYPDLVTLEIAQDNGDIVGFDAQGYLGSHRDRSLREPELTEEDALKVVSHRLKVEDVRLTLIPLETLEEILTYEIKGEYGGDKFLVYINAYTGDEERILHIVDTPDGAMVM